MPTPVGPNARVFFLVAVGLFAAPSSPLAATVWNGPDISFSRATFADSALEANQDRITDSIWITRGTTGGGIFNAASETGFTGTSPADSEWAWELAGFNSGLEIAASNHHNLQFNTWRTANGGQGGGPPSTVGVPGVLHLISEDIYIDIMFTAWGATPGSGGFFAYTRSTAPVPEPGTAMLVTFGLCGLGVLRRARSAKRG